MKRRTILITVCVAAVLAAAAGAGVYLLVHDRSEAEVEAGQNEMATTDAGGFAVLEVPTADPLMVGKWQNAENPQWYKVYYDDYDDDYGYFWGKEWDEAEDVREEDLNYHGNGWFRWRKENNRLTELHTMDAQDLPIEKNWLIKHLSARTPNDSMIITNEKRRAQCFHFTRVL